MIRCLYVLLLLSFTAATVARDTDVQTGIAETIDRTLRKEPAYEETPQYCLIALDASGKSRVWIVEDGTRLYVDWNANDDLTDDGPPVTPGDVRNLGKDRWDLDYAGRTIHTRIGIEHTKFNLARWNYADDKDKYGLSLTLDGQRPMYAGWFGTFWSEEPRTAPVIHFGGRLTPKMLREKSFVIGSGQRRLSMALINPGSGPGAASRLSIKAVPPDVVPGLEIKWPTAESDPPLRTSHRLRERCCYWEFYTSRFQVPDGIVSGTARVSVEFPGYPLPFELTTTEMEVPVVSESTKNKE